MEWIPEERRKRGPPRKTWMEGVQAAMEKRHLETDQWLNRKEWCMGSGRRRQLSQDRKDRNLHWGKFLSKNFGLPLPATYCFILVPPSFAVRGGYSSPFRVIGTKGTVSLY